MASLILDERDQQFLLFEMLGIDRLCEAPLYADFSKDMFEMIINEAQKFATEEVFPTLAESDKEGCRLENGNVKVPKCFHRVYKLYCDAGWGSMCFPPHEGGQGLPVSIRIAAHEWFTHNFSFISYPGLGEGAAHLIGVFGTEAQKHKYMPKMISGEWGGTMCLTEPGAGTDVGNLSTKAIRQPDGTFKIQGTKIFITSGDHDLVSNIVHPVLARIEGDPAGTKGISIFLVPKYLVNDDGSLGRRNDFEIAKIEEKMGIHGSATCLINFGDNGNCYAELMGNEREGMKVMFQLMNEARLGVGLQGLSSASIAYQHAVRYAKERLQGSSLLEFKNPDAPRISIINHPDIRRMLLWMKAHVEGMRAMAYFVANSFDRFLVSKDEAESEKWIGYAEILTPILKAYCSDMGFKVIENAMQIYGGYGFCSEYPIEQFMRDEKIASIFEGANGIQALDLVGRKMGMKKGTYFTGMLGEMSSCVQRYSTELPELAQDVQAGINAIAETGMFFYKCAKEGKYLVPVNNAYPFLMMMGRVVMAWLLLWQAGIAKEKLAGLCTARGIDMGDAGKVAALLKDSKDAAFYSGKISAAKYFIRNVLPEIDSVVKAIRSEDMSILEIAEESF